MQQQQRETDATDIMAKVKKTDICEQFGTQPLTSELIERFERLTGVKAHPFLRRGLYFTHRDFDLFLDAFEQGRPVYIYTGRGPSSDALHLGHMIPFFFCQYLQKAFKCYVVIQITDDEKYLRDSSLDFATIDGYALSNIRDVIACDFDLEKTFIFLNSAYISNVYRFSCEFERLITLNSLRGCFGFSDSCNTGYVSFPPKEMQPAFYRFFPHIFTLDYCKEWKRTKLGLETIEDEIKIKDGMTKQQIQKLMQKKAEIGPNLMPYCLIPSGYEQDPYFRLARDQAPKLGMPKPSTIYNSFIPALRGCDSKMSASDPSNAVYMTDSAAEIKRKINKYAYSGGKATVEEQRQFGANIDIDVSIKYLEVFMDNDEKLNEIKTKYAKGEMLTGEVKAALITELQQVVKAHQERRATITDDFIRQNVYGWGRKLE
ncbi:Tryptophanyl-tRNA_synthetase [Hexamita inflata]|uniref:tryptophan--tRNA ligase n=1 Tax=Hexamita inflata TaxID=28002 RepID=A0AA86NT30_9EUKA|nr:Tryptophanyl-tRNA synthetase [Hexamita inflata]